MYLYAYGVSLIRLNTNNCAGGWLEKNEGLKRENGIDFRINQPAWKLPRVNLTTDIIMNSIKVVPALFKCIAKTYPVHTYTAREFPTNKYVDELNELSSTV